MYITCECVGFINGTFSMYFVFYAIESTLETHINTEHWWNGK